MMLLGWEISLDPNSRPSWFRYEYAPDDAGAHCLTLGRYCLVWVKR